MSSRIPVLYLAPWITYGGSDKNTIDWFRWIDRERFAPYLITTQPSENPLLSEVAEYAEEIWDLPDLMPAERMPEFILDFVVSHGIRVIHLMNSRIGFDLLPDIGSLPRPPAVVVQLHVEEVDRSGYVRYVTTRYGNLVDRFSISNEHVAEAVRGYGVPDEAIEVIYTGVDAEVEFSPERHTPIEPLDGEKLQILFAGRLVEQKDPLLMVEVATALRDDGVDFQIQVVGAGELETSLRERIAERGLGDRVVLHPPTSGLQRWYSACDALLLTSRFEGIPCVLFEAMAMGMPIVAPALPGIRELLSEDDGLIEQRDSAAAYAEPLAHLAADRARLEATGQDLRRRAKERFSVQEMAALHERVYEQLDAGLPRPAPAAVAEQAPPLRFSDRPVAGDPPLVSILIPHFNQTRFLADCLASIEAQTHPNLEVVIVDDASTEAGTAAALEEIERRHGATIVRLDRNGGPSRARNRGLEHCSGRYVLPVDSDNLLLPDAVERLVEQLSAAGEEVGFVYPNLQYFGNRADYYEVPDYNLYTLLYGNFCDTCSLIDREVFDAGLRYSEDIHLGHEDWEFVLQLAARGVRGEAADGPTVRYRKWGFNRSDMVDYASEDFRDDFLAANSPFRGRELEVKAQESPALSLIPLAPIDPASDGGRELARRLAAQRGADAELIGRFAGEWPTGDGAGPAVRRISPELAESRGDAVRQGLEAARGAYAAVTVGDGTALLADPALIAKVLRRFTVASTDLDAIVLVDAGAAGRYSFRNLSEGEGRDAVPHTVIWRRSAELALPEGLHADREDVVGSIARLLCGGGTVVEWRHLEAGEPVAAVAASGSWERIAAAAASVEDPYDLRPNAQALLPGAGEYRLARWDLTPTWVPPHSTIAVRYRERFGETRVITNGIAPPGFDPEYHLGALRSSGFEGTARLVRAAGSYRTLEPGEEIGDAEEIGYIELARLPEMDVLALAVQRTTGQHVLVVLPGDPLLPEVDVIEELGCLDGFPLHPREVSSTPGVLGLTGLTKSVDYAGRRFRYRIGGVPDEGELREEIGGLGEWNLQGSIPAWIVDDYLFTSRYSPPAFRPGAMAALRWAAEPVVWRGLAPPATRVKVMARRAATSARRRGSSLQPAAQPSGPPQGWLFENFRPGRAPLYAAHHPVTGDQCLARSREDIAQLGYAAPQLLGFIRLAAPLTGDYQPRPIAVPWARRFGAVPQTG